jgi:hypothetical protein
VSLGLAGILRTLSGRDLFGALASGASIRKAIASIAGLPISVLHERDSAMARRRAPPHFAFVIKLEHALPA